MDRLNLCRLHERNRPSYLSVSTTIQPPSVGSVIMGSPVSRNADLLASCSKSKDCHKIHFLLSNGVLVMLSADP